jgi:hypothetical protein
MLSKKRQIMFEVMGQRARAARPASENYRADPVRPARKAWSRARAGKRRKIALPNLKGGSWWFAAAGVVLLAVTFVAFRTHAPSGSKPPVLQSNAEQPALAQPRSAGETWSAETFAVCAASIEYKNRNERKLAIEKAQETVQFLGYHADPDFRDVRGYPGKDAGSGTVRVYVGSARSRSELVPLKDKLAAVVWKGQRPFRNATVKLVERVAEPGAKEASDER